MAPGTMVLLESALTFGAPLLLAVHELVALRRHRGGPGRFGGPRDDAPVPPRPGSEPHSPSLPECLLAAARTDAAAGRTKRNRVLEHV